MKTSIRSRWLKIAFSSFDNSCRILQKYPLRWRILCCANTLGEPSRKPTPRLFHAPLIVSSVPRKSLPMNDEIIHQESYRRRDG